MKSLPIRLLTGTLFVALVIGAIWAGLYTYAILFLMVQTLALWELHVLTRQRTQALGSLLFAIIGGALIYAIFFMISTQRWPLSVLTFVPVVLMFSAIPELWNRHGNPFRNFAIIAGGLILICIPLGLLHVTTVYGTYLDKKLLTGILILIWTYDSFAYMTGSLMGRTRLAERISPMKTVEGLIGGALFCCLAAWLLSSWFGVRPLMDWIVFAGCVIIFGTIGDLLESLLKRQAGVKDSGTLLPGHGGVLDRFDNFFFSLPFIATYILLK